MLYANAVKDLCKTEKILYFTPFCRNDEENLQKKQHRSAKAAKI
jgi:hypothetical protein